MIELIVFIAFALVMLLLIAFFYSRDKSVFQKLMAYERAIDDLNRRLYELESKKTPQKKENTTEVLKVLSDVEARLDSKFDEISDPLLRTIRAVKTMEKNLLTLQEKVDLRIAKIEESTKLTSLTNNSINASEQRIIEMFQEGRSIEKIAKKERVSQGEVELILRIANLR